MFKHRFNPETAADFTSVIDAVNIMTGRAKSSLMMMTSYLEGDCDDLHNQDVAGVIYGVLAELEDVSEVLKAHAHANFNLQKQIDLLSEIILQSGTITPERLNVLLELAKLPKTQQDAFIEQKQIQTEPKPEPNNNTVH